MDAQTDRPLDYADPTGVLKPSNPDRMLYVALVCGLLPMTIGGVTTAGWLATRGRLFPLLGLFTILGGCICFLVGAVCLVTHFRRTHTVQERTSRRRAVAMVGAAVVLIANVPLCALCVKLSFLSRVTIINRSATTTGRIVFADEGGVTIAAFSAPMPGKSAGHWVDLTGADDIAVSATTTGAPTTSAVSGGIGQDRIVAFNPDGSISIR